MRFEWNPEQRIDNLPKGMGIQILNHTITYLTSESSQRLPQR